MKKSTEYEQHARECRKLAHGTKNEEHRLALLRVAEAWDSLAIERERLLSFKREEV